MIMKNERCRGSWLVVDAIPRFRFRRGTGEDATGTRVETRAVFPLRVLSMKPLRPERTSTCRPRRGSKVPKPSSLVRGRDGDPRRDPRGIPPRVLSMKPLRLNAPLDLAGGLKFRNRRPIEKCLDLRHSELN